MSLAELKEELSSYKETESNNFAGYYYDLISCQKNNGTMPDNNPFTPLKKGRTRLHEFKVKPNPYDALAQKWHLEFGFPKRLLDQYELSGAI